MHRRPGPPPPLARALPSFLRVLLGLGALLTPVGGSAARAEEPPPAAADPAAEVAAAERLLAQAVEARKAARYVEAHGAALEAFRRLEAALPAGDARLLPPLREAALALLTHGKPGEARVLYERAVRLAEAVTGGAPADLGLLLSELGTCLLQLGELDAAGRALERSLTTLRAVFGEDHPRLEKPLNNLGSLAYERGDLDGARRLFERVVSSRERAGGPPTGALAGTLDNLATVLDDLGLTERAVELYERALAIREQVLGAGHPAVATSASNLAGTLQRLGATAEAGALFARALAIAERTQSAESPLLAGCLNNLGLLRLEAGDAAGARALLERALGVVRAARGEAHPEVAATLLNLADALRAEGAGTGWPELVERALRIQEQTLGLEHPDAARGLVRQARLLIGVGRRPEARVLLDRAAAVLRATLPADHPDVTAVLVLAGRVAAEAGDVAGAQRLLREALAATESDLRARSVALTPARRRDLLQASRGALDAWLETRAADDPEGYAEVLRFKGLVGRVEAAERSLRRRAGAADLELLDRLRAVESRYALLAQQVPPASAAAARSGWQKAFLEAGAERERLGREVAGRLGGLTARPPAATPGGLAQRLGPDEALVDLLRVGTRYRAWVLSAQGPPRAVDLGPAQALEAAAEAFRSAVVRGEGGEPSVAEREAGAALHALLWAPLARHLPPGARRVTVCPDAGLACVPYAALPGRAPGSALADELELRHALEALDLLGGQAAPPGAGTLLLGDVAYGDAPAGAGRRRRFDPLPGTRLEVEGLARLLGKEALEPLVGESASEARLETAVRGRRWLHLATHGFVRDDLLAGLHDRRLEGEWSRAVLERERLRGQDPLAAAGLALAGANRGGTLDASDGLLTALEASYLPLEGVEGVVLSACETARGAVPSGEGVLGLVHAFRLAGARSVVASLWEVDDEATRLLMERLYGALGRPAPPSLPAALREAALALRDRREPDGTRRFAAARFWAPFVAFAR